ncbi:MAG: hypothetical protein QNJ32_03985 [Xenococcaceae cyanobacterium MO_167.B27]|nr:hypothetical protein [Xenococcaceae cyanobacterium MO_167.B27]
MIRSTEGLSGKEIDERGKSASEHSNSTLYIDDKAYKADFSPRADVRRKRQFLQVGKPAQRTGLGTRSS